ncbi:uncharacterized protein LOC142231091 [Haematobia irritans]|uniref:uncharacterized protein LOC142231091 n=1 Tax=Haematobia irritans TaxID=7368 RepID=UPI003F4F7406
MTIYTNIKNNYNAHTYKVAKNYSKSHKQSANLKSSITFLIKCKKAEYKHKQIHENRQNIQTAQTQLTQLLSQQDLSLYLESENTLYNSVTHKNKTTHIKKLDVLKQQHKKQLNIRTHNDWFVNKTEKDIPREVQWILSLGPKHALPHNNKSFPLLQVIAEGEDCVQTIESREEQEMARTKLTTLINDHLRRSQMSLRDKYISSTVVQTRQYLKENDDILILSADKGGKTVAMNKIDYDLKMKEILHDMCTYKRIKIDPTSRLQTKNNKLVEKLYNLNIITEQEKNKLTSRTAVAPRIYGLPKIHKESTPLRPICSSIDSPSYNLCKYIVGILRNITLDSKYNVKDSADFKTRLENMTIEDDEVLISFDVVSLFPSIPVKLAIQTIERKWTIIEQYTNMTKDLFIDLITFCIKDTRYFKFEDKIYEQLKGMPMGSPASPIVADIIMEELLDEVFKNITKPPILTKYVDDIFAIIKASEVDETLKALNSFNRQIQFTKELEQDNKLPYLDVIIHRQENQLRLNWYQKPTASGRLLNFYSKHIKANLHNNRELTKKKDSQIYKPVTYIPNFSERLSKSDIYNKEKYQLALKTTNTVNGLFSKTKTKIKNEDQHNVVYKIKCNDLSLYNCYVNGPIGLRQNPMVGDTFEHNHIHPLAFMDISSSIETYGTNYYLTSNNRIFSLN